MEPTASRRTIQLCMSTAWDDCGHRAIK